MRKNTMRSRVLRSNVQEHEICIVAVFLQAPFFGFETQRFHFNILFFIKHLEWSHFSCPRRMFLA